MSNRTVTNGEVAAALTKCRERFSPSRSRLPSCLKVENSEEVNDPFDLERFVRAQENDYAQALSEIKAGRKRSHWMWYLFPQIQGLGFSAMSQRFAIRSRAEARAYLAHPLLGPRLLNCVESLLTLEGRTAEEIFGPIDTMKLKSCTTLFAAVSAPDSIFHQLLAKYFDGESDQATLRLLES